MRPTENATTGGASSRLVDEPSSKGKAVESVRPDRHDATIEGLTTALGRLRRGAEALHAENRELRRQIAELRSDERGRVSREASAHEFGQLAEVALPTGCGAPGAARIVLARCLHGLVSPHILEDAQLLVTELVTNSVLHGELVEGDLVLVRIYLAADALRLEVENSGTAGVIASNTDDPRAGRGFGLELLERLVTRWGVRRDQSTTVWLETSRA